MVFSCPEAGFAKLSFISTNRLRGGREYGNEHTNKLVSNEAEY
jgi:hypothetical protein